jgi:hypothetical protein
LKDVVERFSDAMAKEPMPDYLIEVLLALREAGMTDHREVNSYGARAGTPLIATASQDHAMELVASVGAMESNELAEALEERELDWQLQQRLLGGIMAPFERSFDFIDRRSLEREISEYEGGTRVVSVHKALELQGQLLSLPMTDLTRADLTASLSVATDPEYEAILLGKLHLEVKMMRSRHRRVRNAINHGNPLPATTLKYICGFSDRTAQAALALALEAYASKRSIMEMIKIEQAERRKQRRQLTEGFSYLERNPPASKADSP